MNDMNMIWINDILIKQWHLVRWEVGGTAQESV